MRRVRPRLLVIPEFTATGGTRTFFLTIARYYSRSPFDVYVALENGQIDPEIERIIRECNLRLLKRRSCVRPASFMSKFPFCVIAGWLEARPLIARIRPDLLVVSAESAGRWLALLASVQRVIFFVHSYPEFRTGKSLRDWVRRQVFSRFVSSSNTIVTVSNFARRQLLAAWTRDGESANIKVIPNTTRPDMPERSLRARGESGVINVITMGHVVTYKNPYLWIHVAEEVVREETTVSVRFLWAGDGPLLEECRSTVHARGLGDFLEFVGPVGNVAEFLEMGDIYFQPSDNESQGISVLEAMRFGLPCVVTAVGGMPESVRNGETGFVVPAGDIKGLASAISALVRDAGFRDRLGYAGSQRYSAEYSFSLWESRMRHLHQERLAEFCSPQS